MTLPDNILVLDGAFGTMAQALRLDAEAYKLDGKPAPGCNDVLCLTHPGAVEDIHTQYIEAGADIITTNSFNSNAISLSDYGLEDRVSDIAYAAARIARKAADKSKRKVIVAGSIGPTNRTLSMSPDINRPEYREVTYKEMRCAYREQAKALIDGGVDILLVETVFDTLNAKAAISGIRDASPDIPIIISGTLSDASGRTLSGQTVEAFMISIAHAHPLAVGLNCGFGAKHLLPYLRRLAAVSPFPVSVHPNAGLPNVAGEYDETPEMFANDMLEYVREGLVNIVGGCCGTTPRHISALKKALEESDARPRINHKEEDSALCLSGLEPLRIHGEFTNIGERANVAGSAKFARLIREGDYAAAVEKVRQQVEAGANVIDICMDDAMIDGVSAMSRFILMLSAEPDIAKVPIMIDSSHWDVIEAGLQCTQGKSIVNSISLKEGEEIFLERARAIMGYGAAVVVMLFDEKGQADTFQRKKEVAQRAYQLLTGIGFPTQDIIFDPNILAIATGMPEHNRYALDYIEAVRWIKSNLPGAKISGGVSNLSFSFRGNNAVRKAMHSAFLYHAIAAGMDMAIVNPQMIGIYDDIEPMLLRRVEDAILCRDEDSADRLIDFAAQMAKSEEKAPEHTSGVQKLPLEERLSRAMLNGDVTSIESDAIEAHEAKGSAIAVVNEMLMPAMERVGQRFGEGKMFLPQVVKSARVMKLAVDALFSVDPTLHTSEQRTKGAIVLATVKGDVHDIGKNIVSVVLACNGFKVYDMGVMVEPEQIVAKAMETGADAIGLSGLITPSLYEMMRVAEEAERQKLNLPIIIGGATTSALHTAMKIAPVTQAPVIHARDAAETSRILSILLSDLRDAFIAENAMLQKEMAKTVMNEEKIKAKKTAVNKPVDKSTHKSGIVPVPNLTLSEIAESINWAFFFAAWGIPGKIPEIFSHPHKGDEAKKLYDDAKEMLSDIIANRWLEPRIVAKTFDAVVDGDDILLKATRGCSCECCGQPETFRLPMLRGEECVADFVEGKVTLFALSAAFGLEELQHRFQDDEYKRIMAKFLADRLTEAFAERAFPYGCRFAFGYPSVPDHTLKRLAFDILEAEKSIGMTLTENFMIQPGESICGIWLPKGHYFQLGALTESQLAEYADRRNASLDYLRQFLSI